MLVCLTNRDQLPGHTTPMGHMARSEEHDEETVRGILHRSLVFYEKIQYAIHWVYYFD